MNQKTNKNKLPYEKPLLRVIELDTEQVLGAGCKLDAGLSNSGDPASCTGNFCAEAGS
ncbi:MAG: hypothetical protein KAW12_02710 [Candidatus Aminicenantes bacterium]|nr:hypothetical protein [Candidatus Aminicenantes bacterium]